MKKSTLIMILSLVLAVALGVGGTLAYLQDTDEDVNVMTLGNVHIEQHEYERVTDENGDPVKGVEGKDFKADYDINESYKLQEFTQGKPAYPAVYQKGKLDWDEFQQLWNQVGAPGSNDLFDDSMKNVVDKFVFVENTGKSDAYYRTIIAIEDPEGLSIDEQTIHTSFNANSRFDYNSDVEGVQNAANSNKFYTEIDGTRYLVYVATYQEPLTPGEVSRPSLLQLYLDPMATNEDVALFGETWDVLVVSQAVQTQGFENAQQALDTAFGVISEDSHPWMDLDGKTDEEGDQAPDGAKFPVLVSTADELVAAIAAGGDVYLTENIDVDANTAITIASGKDVTLNLNGYKISATADKTGNQELFLVKGNMTVKNGSLGLTAENNQEWNAMATLFDVTAGGVLNMDGVTANVSGTDMNFVVHLNNWGEATLNMNDCDITTTYCGVRAFNSGYDMNNVTIKNSDFSGGRMFWVHNYTSEGKDDSTLNLDIYNNGNTSDNVKPVRFGFNDSVYYDINGVVIQ